MKAKILTTIACLLLMAGFGFSQTTQSINLYTSGSTSATSITLTPGSVFSLDAYMTFAGFTAIADSYWLEASSPLAPHLTLTNSSTFQNWDPQSTGSNTPFATSDSGTNTNFLRETRDLGGSSNFDSNSNPTDPKSPGTYMISTLNFSLDSSIAPGTYTIALTNLGSVPSEIADNGFVNHDVAGGPTGPVYTITVVPEPATLSLLALSGLGSLGLNVLRRRRRS